MNISSREGLPSVYGRAEVNERITQLARTLEHGGSGGLIIEGPLGSGRACALRLAVRTARAAGLSVLDVPPRVPRQPTLICRGDLGRVPPRSAIDDLAGRPGVGWLIATARIDGTPDLPGLGTVSRVQLTPLAPPHALAMAGDRLGRGPSARERSRLAATGGWPALVAASLGNPKTLPAVAAAIRSEWSPAARKLAEVAAALTVRLDGSTLTAVSGRTPGRVLETIDELLVNGVLVDDGEGRLSFTSTLLRDLIAAATPAVHRRQFRREALRAWLRPGAQPSDGLAELAELMTQSRVRMTADERSLLLEAVEALSASQPATAGSIAARLFSRSTTLDPGRIALALRATELTGLAGDCDHAVRIHRQAVATATDDRDRRELHRAICGAPWAPLPVRVESGRELEALVGRSEITPDHLADAVAYDRILAGLSAPPTRDTDYGRLAQVVQDLAHGSFGDALTRLDGVSFAGPAGRNPMGHVVAMWRCESLLGLDRFDETLGVIETYTALADEHGLDGARQGWTLLRGRLAAQRGQLAFAAEQLTAALGGSPLRTAARFCAGEVALRRARPTAVVRQALRQAHAAAASEFPEAVRHGRWFEVLHGLAFDAPGPPVSEWTLPTLGRDPLAEITLVRAAIAQGDRDGALRALDAAERRAAANPETLSLRAAALQSRGLVRSDPALLTAAVEIFAAGERRLAHADALCDLADHVTGNSQTPILDDALARYVDCDARRDARRVRQRLNAQGITRRSRSRSRPEQGWAALTPAELAVVRAVASGMTNRAAAERLTLSPHTVNAHLRKCFAKLGIASRMELARMMVAHDDSPAGPAPNRR